MKWNEHGLPEMEEKDMRPMPEVKPPKDELREFVKMLKRAIMQNPNGIRDFLIEMVKDNTEYEGAFYPDEKEDSQ